MSKEEITYKELAKAQLDRIKDIYVESRLNQMSESDLRLYVKTAISDQIKSTVGNEEEREAWIEMRDHFDSKFQEKIKEVIMDKNLTDKASLSTEQIELEKRLKYLEERNKENEEKTEDMW